MSNEWKQRALPDVGYLVRYRLGTSGLHVDVEAYEIVGDWGEMEARGLPGSEERPHVFLRRGATTSSDVVDNVTEAERWLHGEIKWDGCSNLHIDAQDDCMLHFHGKEGAVAVGLLLAALYDIAHETLPRPDW